MTRKQLIGGSILLVCLFPLLVLALIPAAQVEGVVQRLLAREGLTFTAGRFGMAFPLGITARNVTLADSRGPLLRFDRLDLRPRLFPLLSGTLAVAADATVGSGRVELLWRSGNKGGLSADIRGLPLEQLPLFRTVAGASVKGLLRGEARLTGIPPRLSGTIRVQATGVELADLKIGEMPLPAVSDETIQGMLRVKDGRGRVESLTFEGVGLYARLSGDIPLSPADPLDLSLELMPRADFLERQKFVFLLLIKYQDSPGHYRLPIRGTLAKPAVL